jgi:hypothetical protein
MATAEPKPHTCRLTLTIDGTEYTVRPLTVAWYGRRAFRLRKADGTSYIISRDGIGQLACECGDYVWRHEPEGTHCKHLRAARALGIL